jgi:hypothetical protein
MTTRTVNRKSSAMNQMNHLIATRRQLLAEIQNTPVIRSLTSARPDLESYEIYLTNIWHYMRHNAVVVGLASIRCVAVNPVLADYFLRRAHEELGRERWAAADLATLGVTEKDLAAAKPSPSCAAMIGYEYYVAGHCNPVSLFGWLYMLEAMNEDLGPLIANQLSRAFSPSTGIRFVRAHGKTDELQTWDLMEQIAEHVSPIDMAEVNHVADVVSQLYLGMFEQPPPKNRRHDNAAVESQ